MKKIDLGQAIQILANLGVITGIFFLVIELQQNNSLLQAEAARALAQNRASNSELLKASPEFAKLLVKLERGEELTRFEQFQEEGFYLSFITNWAWEFGEYRQGRLTEAQLPTRVWRDIAHGRGPVPAPRFANTWQSVKIYYDPVFAEFMDSEVLSE